MIKTEDITDPQVIRALKEATYVANALNRALNKVQDKLNILVPEE